MTINCYLATGPLKKERERERERRREEDRERKRKICEVYCVLVWVLQHITQKQQVEMMCNTPTRVHGDREKKDEES